MIHTRAHLLVVVLCTLSLFAVERADAQPLPEGWAAADIGAVGIDGTSSGGGGSFEVSGGGADIWNSADAFRFVYTTLTGDGSIVAHVTSVEAVAPWTKAGVMMRASLSPGSQHGFMLAPGSATKGLAFQRRPAADGSSVHTGGPNDVAPYWLKLVRAGSVLTASVSPTGSTWTTVGSQTMTAMPSTIYVGLAVGSHVAGRLATATFESVTIAGDTAPPPTTTATLVFFRHGEKPPGGYGQITCQGLNRALALPPVLLGRYGTPQHLFAPNPLPQVGDQAGYFDYVRPLATIEPTAIRLGMPVNASIGHTDVAGLKTALMNLAVNPVTIFISWEHLKLKETVQSIMNTYGGGAPVPSWASGDYDSLYVVRVTNTGGALTAEFSRDVEGLNGLSTSCP